MKIVCIGGGNKEPAISRALDMSGKSESVLVLPTACSTENSYYRKVPLIVQFFKDLGVSARVLHEFKEVPTHSKIQDEIGKSSLIYTVGGNTPHLMKTLREHGTDEILKEAVKKGETVHAGTSAGALLFFDQAHTCPAKNPDLEAWDYEYLTALGLINGVGTAHANTHDPVNGGRRPDSRLEALVATFPPELTVGYAIDNGAAVIFDDQIDIVRSDSSANVHLLLRDQTGNLTQQIL